MNKTLVSRIPFLVFVIRFEFPCYAFVYVTSMCRCFGIHPSYHWFVYLMCSPVPSSDVCGSGYTSESAFSLSKLWILWSAEPQLIRRAFLRERSFRDWRNPMALPDDHLYERYRFLADGVVYHASPDRPLFLNVLFISALLPPCLVTKSRWLYIPSTFLRPISRSPTLFFIYGMFIDPRFTANVKLTARYNH